MKTGLYNHPINRGFLHAFRLRPGSCTLATMRESEVAQRQLSEICALHCVDTTQDVQELNKKFDGAEIQGEQGHDVVW